MSCCRKLFLLTAAVFLLAQAGSIEAVELRNKDEQRDIIDLERILVTPTRQEIFVKDAPSKVTLVSEKEIKRMPSLTLDEVFKYVPESTVVGDSIYQTMKRQVTLRGVPDQSRTLVMVDGIPINSAWQGRVDWGLVPLEHIEKIEVVHGPMSTLYGSGAMGGVINIITEFPEKPSQTFLNAKYGSLDSYSSTFSQGGRFDKFSYHIGGSFFQTDGYLAERAPEVYSVKRDRKDISFSTKLAYSLDEDAGLVLGYLHNDEDVCRGREYFNIDDKANLGYLSYNKSLEEIRLKGTLFINDQDWRREFDKGPNYNYLDMVENIDHTYIGTILETGFSLGERNMLTAGIDYKHGDIHLKDSYQRNTRKAEANGEQHLASIFLQDEIRFLDERLIATLGLRGDYCKSYRGWCFDTGQAAPKVNAFYADYNDRDWTDLSPKASLVYHLRDTTRLRMSFGRAFHAPDLKQLYMVLARPQKTIYCNAELDPETLNSYEAGVNHAFFDDLILDLSLYYSRGDDFIDTRTIAANTFEYDNITKVEISGIEAALRYKINNDWSVTQNYTFNKSTIDEDSSDPSLDGNYLSLQPLHRAATEITYDNPDLFTLSAVLYYVGSMYSDLENTDKLKGYCGLDLRISKKLKGNIELSLLCQNLFDKEYDIANAAAEDIVSPGRMITGSLTLKW